MGQEQEPVRVRAAGGPTRCPFCHENVDRERDEWVACEACLCRHHAACWNESHGCAACGEKKAMARERELLTDREIDAARQAPQLDPNVASVDLELRGTRVHFEGLTNLALAIPRGHSEEPFEVRVKNASERPQRIEVRHLAPWLHADGPTEVQVAPGSTGVLRLRVDAKAAPFVAERPNADAPGTRGVSNAFPYVARAPFTLSCDEDATQVQLEVVRELDGAQRRSMVLFLGVMFHVGLIFAAIHASRGKPVERLPGESMAAFLVRERTAKANRDLARSIGRASATTIGLVALLVGLFLSLRLFLR